MTATTIELPPTDGSARPRPGRGRIAGAIALAVVGVLLALVGAGGIALQLIAGDDDGYLTRSADLRTNSFALATDEMDLDSIDEIPAGLRGTVRIRVEPDGGRPTFLGIGRSEDVQRYLHGVRHAQVSDFNDGGDARYEEVPGGPLRSLPATRSFWAAQSRGPGDREIEWKPQAGEWEVVAFNADGSRGLALHAEAGARLGWLIWVALGLAVAGVALMALAVAVWRRGSTGGAASSAS